MIILDFCRNFKYEMGKSTGKKGANSRARYHRVRIDDGASKFAEPQNCVTFNATAPDRTASDNGKDAIGAGRGQRVKC